MKFVEQFIPRYEIEQNVSRRVIAAIPADKLDWRPHAKSMALGRLAWHLAEISRFFAPALLQDEITIGGESLPVPQSKDEIIDGFDRAVSDAVAAMGQIDNERFIRPLALRAPNGKVIVEMPVVGYLNGLILGHTIHHRGQMSVYLRLLDVPVPSIYGPTADAPMDLS